MNLVFFTHPEFLGQQSMRRFANMLTSGMRQRGHSVENWSPVPIFFRFPSPDFLRKWFGYIDQYVLFPLAYRKKIKATPKDTLFVFIDQALGPWVRLVADRPHVIHCHDFLALRSALGEIPENPTSWTGVQYQSMIRRGFSKGKHFISVSHKTKDDLHRFLITQPVFSDVVYNGFHKPFDQQDPMDARRRFGERIQMDLADGYLLHVGANVWYKNRAGVVEIFDAWRSKFQKRLPLLMIGEPTTELLTRQELSPFKRDIHWLKGIDDESLRQAYAGATAFLFPSLGEGFGWPIAEAMASGCPVITTDEAPMTEVAGAAGFFIPRMPNDRSKLKEWADHSSSVLQRVVSCSASERDAIVGAGIENAKRFDTIRALDQIEDIYGRILSKLVTKE
ncbi:MAG TPA: glycosyltransferase family 1 protein [Chryseolinea sp.]|nr:glycosyltransferase family 1 protein [Chryseolinea sp.]